jgi:hypothetical protein
MHSEECRRVSYGITEEDLFRFYIYHFRYRSSYRLFLLLCFLIMFALVTFLVSDWGLGWGLAAGLVTVVGYAFAMRGLLRWKAKNAKRAFLGLIGEHHIEIRPDGFYQSTSASEGVRRWDGFYEIVSAPEAIYFYMGKEFAFLVPRRAFASREQAEAFLEAAQKWHSEARALPERSMDEPAPVDENEGEGSLRT